MVYKYWSDEKILFDGAEEEDKEHQIIWGKFKGQKQKCLGIRWPHTQTLFTVMPASLTSVILKEMLSKDSNNSDIKIALSEWESYE